MGAEVVRAASNESNERESELAVLFLVDGTAVSSSQLLFLTVASDRGGFKGSQWMAGEWCEVGDACEAVGWLLLWPSWSVEEGLGRSASAGG